MFFSSGFWNFLVLGVDKMRFLCIAGQDDYKITHFHKDLRVLSDDIMRYKCPRRYSGDTPHTPQSNFDKNNQPYIYYTFRNAVYHT